VNKEELEKELEYIKDVIKDLRPNDEDRSFYFYQKNEIEKKLEEIESDRNI